MGRKFRYALGEPDERNVTVLTLKLRIALEPLDTGGEGGTAIVKARGGQFKCVHYPPSEFEAFKTRFPRSVSQLWSGKIFIAVPEPGAADSMPPEGYKRFAYAGMSRFKPVVECRLEVELNDIDPHYRLTVIKRAPGEKRFPSFTFPDKKEGRPDGVLDSTDLDMKLIAHTVKDNGKVIDKDFERYTAAHEVGHLLGLDHVNLSHPVCKLDANDEICYGDNIWKSQDMMGVGHEVRAWHGRPWLYVLKKVTNHDKGWRLTTDPTAAGGAPVATIVDQVKAAFAARASRFWQELGLAG